MQLVFFFISTGVAIGMGLSNMWEIYKAGQTLAERGYKKVSPHLMTKALVNMAAGNVSLRNGLQVGGGNFVMNTWV